MTHPTLEALLALRDGEADAGAEAHVKTCAACQKTLSDLVDLRDSLVALPSAEPPADGWSRLQGRLRAEQRARTLARCGWAAAAAMVLFTATVAVRGGLEAWHEATLQQQMKALVAESQRLEDMVRTSEASGRIVSGRTAYAIADLQGRIEVLDARLAAARRDKQPTNEVIDLWQQRVALLDDLASVQTARVAYVGI
ncbi:MAG TPA: hypothetical protein PLP31_12635 [Thermoanaerobaculaceae bacterium]|nr:hypothetical protein [Thermoanaerobaculaceae bacterium]